MIATMIRRSDSAVSLVFVTDEPLPEGEKFRLTLGGYVVTECPHTVRVRSQNEAHDLITPLLQPSLF
jgi:hypothetical protein